MAKATPHKKASAPSKGEGLKPKRKRTPKEKAVDKPLKQSVPDKPGSLMMRIETDAEAKEREESAVANQTPPPLPHREPFDTSPAGKGYQNEEARAPVTQQPKAGIQITGKAVLIIIGCVLLLLLILRLSRKTPSFDTKPIQDSLAADKVSKRAYDSLKLLYDSSRQFTDEAIRIAKLSQEEREQKEWELQQANKTISDYLGKQKTNSDATKKIIRSGDARQLDSVWRRFKLSRENR